MLNKIISASLGNRLIVLFIALGMLLYGLKVTDDMEVDVFPDLTAPTVAILTEARGMAPEDVERMISFPIETAVNGATNVRRVRSVSSMGFSIVWVDFDWGMDAYIARQIVSEKLSIIKDQLPERAGEPFMAPQSSIMGEIMLVVLKSDSVSPMDLRTIADWDITPRLQAINGVSQIVTMGGDYKVYQIEIDPAKLSYYGISTEEIANACRNMNINSKGGILNDFGQEYIIRGMSRTSDLEDLGLTLVAKKNGKPVLLHDVAEIKTGPQLPKFGEAFYNGQRSVVMTVLKQPHSNTLELTDKIDEALSDISNVIPQGVEVNSHVFRQSDFISRSVNNVGRALMEGAVFVVIILFLFLMNFRTTLISLLAIPLSLIITIITLKWMGLTINTMSLGGMAIAIGDLVDDAIIDVENVLKRLKENHKRSKEERESHLKVIFNASVEIRSSIIHATLIIIVAFMPLFFLSGMEGRMLQPLGISFIVSLFASLLVALTITPVLSSYLLTTDKQLRKPAEGVNLVVRKLNEGYRKLLDRLLHYKKWVIGIPLALFVFAVFLLSNFGRSFLPEFNEGVLTLTTNTIPGVSLEESNKLNAQLEKILMEMDEVQDVTRRTGRAEMSEHAHGGVDASEIDVPFVLNGESFDEFRDEVREALSVVPGLNIIVGQPLSHRIDHMLSGTRAQIAMKVYGKDISKMFELGNAIKNKASQIEGIVDLNVEQLIEVPQVQIKPRRQMLAQYGIALPDFNAFIGMALGGEQLGDVFEENRKYRLIGRFKMEDRNSIEKIRDMIYTTDDGRRIPLAQIADISSAAGPVVINRENVQRKLVVSANVSGIDLHSAVNQLKEMVNSQIDLPEGYYVEFGGQFESEAEASRRLLLTSIFALLIIFLLLFQEFKSIGLAGIIMINLPLALIGGVFAILISGGQLSIPSIIGFITLFGIATRNGILLVSRFQHLRQEGESSWSAVIKGATDRLNPILMTALTAALALIPLVVYGDKPGNEIQSPMAVVILGGLLTSTLLNLFVIPAVYLLFTGKQQQDVNAERSSHE